MVAVRVFLDFAIGDEPVGRVIFELFNTSAPKTSENFRSLCTGERGVSPISQVPLYYKNSIVHRSIRDFMIQGGDFIKRNGTGGESIYGSTFPDEDLSRPIDEPGLLCMANKGPNTNGSQFFITLAPSTHLNGKHVVFGRVVRGFDEVVCKLTEVATDAKDRPTTPIVISNCGELELKKPPPKQIVQKQASESASESDDGEERGRKSKRRKRSVSRSADSRSRSPSQARSIARSRSATPSDASERKSRKKRSKHTKDRKEKKRSRKRKHQRSGSPHEEQNGKSEHASPKPPRQETEEEYDARLEREEKERIEAARRRELEVIKERFAEEARRKEKEGDSAGGIRYKGRGRMKYIDPETESRRYGH